MLPIGKGRGELWNGNTFLCLVDYDISEPLPFVTDSITQRIDLIVHTFDCETLLKMAGITLILADGSRYRLPRLINLVDRDQHLECYLSFDR